MDKEVVHHSGKNRKGKDKGEWNEGGDCGSGEG